MSLYILSENLYMVVLLCHKDIYPPIVWIACVWEINSEINDICVNNITQEVKLSFNPLKNKINVMQYHMKACIQLCVHPVFLRNVLY